MAPTIYGSINTSQKKQSVSISGTNFHGLVNPTQKKQSVKILGTNFHGLVNILQKKQSVKILGTNFHGALFTLQKKQTTKISAAMNPPGAPTLISPPSVITIGVFKSLVLYWNDTGAASYRLQVSKVPGFSTVVYDQNGITEKSQLVTGLSANTIYYWRVNATNGGGTSSWSSVWQFTTGEVDFSVITPLSHEGYVPLSVQFGYTGTYTGIASYSWDFGDNNSATGAVTSNDYIESGVYSVGLTIYGATGAEDSIIKNDCILVNEVYAESENTIIESYCHLPYKNWRFYVDTNMHLVFYLGLYSYRSATPVVNMGEWTLVEFHPGSNRMYVSTVASGRQSIPCYQILTGYTGPSDSEELLIAKNSSLKIDELRIVNREEDLTSYFGSLRGHVYYLNETPISVVQPEIKLSGMMSCVGWARSFTVADGDILVPLAISDPYGNVVGNNAVGIDTAVRMEILRDGFDYRLQYLGSKSKPINKSLKINVNDDSWHFFGYECDANGNMTFYVDAMVVPAEEGLDSYALPYSVAKSTAPRVGGGDVWSPYLCKPDQVIHLYNWRFGKDFNLGQEWIQQLMTKEQQIFSAS